MAKIGVFHVPFYSHIGALTRLSQVLSRQGHEVVAWGPEPSRERIEEYGATFLLHEPQMPNVDGFLAFVAALATTTEECAGEIVEQLFEQDVDLVIHDSQTPWARVAADYLGLPRIISHPMFPIVSPHQIRSEADWTRPAPHPADAEAQLQKSWLAIATTWGVELGEWAQVIHSTAETTIAYTTEEILGDHQLPPGWEFVGPLMEPMPAAQTDGRPLVFACFGTSFNARPEQFSSVIEGLAEEPVDVLISTGKGRVSAEALGPLPANVALRDFVPAREMLARTSIYITHGGNNSVHEALLAGVPMLCIPQAYDQFPLTVRVQELGAGRIVAEDAAEIRDGVRYLLEDERPRSRARELGRHLTEFDSETRVARAIERVLEHSAAVGA